MPDVRSGRPSLRAARMPGLALCLTLLFPLAAQGAEPLKDWPCREPMVAPLTAAMVWPDRHPEALAVLPSDRAWEADPRVRDLVEFAANPENSPDVGGAAIARFAAGQGPDRQVALMLTLSGVVDLTNRLRAIMIDGIGVNVTRSEILAEQVNANTAALASAQDSAAPNPADIRQARFWNLRRLDKAEDDAAMICRKIAYSERKLRALAQAVSKALD